MGSAEVPIDGERRTRILARISGALASRDEAALRAALERGGRLEPGAVEEVLVQSYLFLGFPLTLNGFALWREVAGVPAPPPVREPAEAVARRGEEVCGRVYGRAYDALRERVAALHPDLDRWMIEEGYGKVLGRPGLPLRERELCIVALLAVLDVPTQLFSHLRGALHVGATAAEVETVLAEVHDLVPGEAARERTGETWRRVRERKTGRPGASEPRDSDPGETRAEAE